MVIYFGAGLILSNSMSIGMLFAFMAYKRQFSENIIALIERLFEFRMLSLHLERVADISFERPEVDLDAPLEADNIIRNRFGRRSRPPEQLTGKIEFRDVWFKYGDEDPWILKGVSFTVRPKELVVITGPSGGGKTTLLKLILGLDIPNKGEILVDDMPLSSFDIRAYRQCFGTVMQQDALMSGTVAENVSFFDDNADIDRIAACARAASIQEEIDRMPMKYDTLIGHMGSSLSGGQQQRLLLARALYRQPTFLVMDEGTANLDADNERAILVNIKSLPATRITVAHKDAVIEAADRLFVMAQGTIIEQKDDEEFTAKTG